jgi:hypothetical protein
MPNRMRRPTATATPTPAPPTAAQIFDRLSPAVAFVEMPLQSNGYHARLA